MRMHTRNSQVCRIFFSGLILSILSMFDLIMSNYNGRVFGIIDLALTLNNFLCGNLMLKPYFGDMMVLVPWNGQAWYVYKWA